jgi:hypothetical protein
MSGYTNGCTSRYTNKFANKYKYKYKCTNIATIGTKNYMDRTERTLVAVNPPYSYK